MNQDMAVAQVGKGSWFQDEAKPRNVVPPVHQQPLNLKSTQIDGNHCEYEN